MQVEQFIKESILKYPLLYKDINYKYSREKVLDQLFFTNGNGLEWENGELSDGSKQEIAEENIVPHIPQAYFDTAILSKEEDESMGMTLYRKETGKAFRPREECSKLPNTIYPICKYAAILNLPDNIKKDWLLAAEDAYNMAIDFFTDPLQYTRDYYIVEWCKERKYSKVKEYIEEQMNYLEQARKRIEVLKK